MSPVDKILDYNLTALSMSKVLTRIYCCIVLFFGIVSCTPVHSVYLYDNRGTPIKDFVFDSKPTLKKIDQNDNKISFKYKNKNDTVLLVFRPNISTPSMQREGRLISQEEIDYFVNKKSPFRVSTYAQTKTFIINIPLNITNNKLDSTALLIKQNDSMSYEISKQLEKFNPSNFGNQAVRTMIGDLKQEWNTAFKKYNAAKYKFERDLAANAIGMWVDFDNILLELINYADMFEIIQRKILNSALALDILRGDSVFHVYYFPGKYLVSELVTGEQRELDSIVKAIARNVIEYKQKTGDSSASVYLELVGYADGIPISDNLSAKLRTLCDSLEDPYDQFELNRCLSCLRRLNVKNYIEGALSKFDLGDLSLRNGACNAEEITGVSEAEKRKVSIYFISAPKL